MGDKKERMNILFSLAKSGAACIIITDRVGRGPQNPPLAAGLRSALLFASLEDMADNAVFNHHKYIHKPGVGGLIDQSNLPVHFRLA